MLNISRIINITVDFPSSSVTTQNFSLGLILSKNSVVSKTDRVKTYSSVDDMVTAGFASNSVEVAAATLYFSQNPAPSQIAVGVKDDAETAVAALTACRAANNNWYACLFIGAVKADISALAAYVESASPATVMFYTTSDSDVLAGTAGNVCLTLQTAKYRRTIGQYSTYANAAASIMGYACGAASTAYDLAFKPEPGVSTESLTSAQASILDGENCNYYAAYNDTYKFFMKGVMADGSHFDEVIGIDILTADIQAAMMAAITSAKKIPQTDAGTTIITAAISGACNAALKRGFIAPGTWNGATVLNLATGASLASGYSIQAETYSNISSADKAARKTPPIYVCIILAGSGESFTIAVNVER